MTRSGRVVGYRILSDTAQRPVAKDPKCRNLSLLRLAQSPGARTCKGRLPSRKQTSDFKVPIDRSVKRVHIDVNDFSRGHLRAIPSSV